MKQSKFNIYLQLIEGYELSLEIETDEQKIKIYRDLIEGYKLALELEEEEEIKIEPIKEVEPIQEVMNEEVAQDDFTPSYLMTLDEYKEKVTPLIQAYKKFLKKNSNWFVKPDYYGIAHYSFEEAFELKDSPNAVFMDSYGREIPTEEKIRRNYSYKKTRNFDEEYTQEPTPPNLIAENKDFIKKLKKYFTFIDLNEKIQDDETKSNKRAVRRAIDNNTYKNLLTNKEVQLRQLENVADSVGIKLPKSIFDKATQNQMKYEEELGKLLSNIPALSLEKLKELIEQIKIDLKPLEDEVYEREYERYSEIINDNIGKTFLAEKLNPILPIWDKIYVYEAEYKDEQKTDWRGSYYTSKVRYENLIELKSDWENKLSVWLKEVVDNLKNSIIIAIMSNFQNINIPIEFIERLKIEVGFKGFEGSYKFTFVNGSSFVMNFQGIGAGGYNIQKYHFRFLTNFSDVKLTDGSKGGNNYYDITNNFSVKNN